MRAFCVNPTKTQCIAALLLLGASRAVAAGTTLYDHFFVPAGTTGSNPATDILAPRNTLSSDFGIGGAYTNAGIIRASGFLESAGFFVTATGSFTNSGSSALLEQVHGSNAHLINNDGVWRTNTFSRDGDFQNGSAPVDAPLTNDEPTADILRGFENTATGSISNTGTFFNHGTLHNHGQFYNGLNFTSAWNSNNPNVQFLIDNGLDKPYQVRVVNFAGAQFDNGGLFDNGTAADFQQFIRTSTLVNNGLFGNLVIGGHGHLRNFDLVENNSRIVNSDGGLIENYGDIGPANVQPGLDRIENGGQLINKHAAQIFASTLINKRGSVTTLGEIVAGTINNSGEITSDFQVVQNQPPFTPQNPPLQSVAGFITVGKLINGATGRVVIRGGMSVNQEFDNNGEVIVAPGGGLGGDGVFKQTAGKTEVQGTFSRGNVMVSGGEFNVAARSALSGGGFVQQVPNTPFTQTGGKVRNDGVIVTKTYNLEGGVYGGAGRLLGDFTNGLTDFNQTGGTMAPGDPVTSTINGNYHLLGGTLDIQIASLAAFDKVVVTGLTELAGGTIQLDFINGFAPQAGDTFNFLESDNVTLTPFVKFIVTGLANGFDFDVFIDGNGLRFQAFNDGVAVAPVPLPPAVWLLISALGMVTGVGRRTQR